MPARCRLCTQLTISGAIRMGIRSRCVYRGRYGWAYVAYANTSAHPISFIHRIVCRASSMFLNAFLIFSCVSFLLGSCSTYLNLSCIQHRTTGSHAAVHKVVKPRAFSARSVFAARLHITLRRTCREGGGEACTSFA